MSDFLTEVSDDYGFVGKINNCKSEIKIIKQK